MISGTLVAGQVFHDRYEIVRCLKAGGMGAVYECIHLKTRKRRALKVMLPQMVVDANMRERFELEARITADIESEHIVETFDAGVDEKTGAPFLVMELLRGEELGGLLKRRGALPADEVVLLLSQAALALDRTHAAGIVHRDLKPDNFFVTSRDDGSPRLKILDFGVAKVVADGSRTIQQTAAIGTPLYMSPEQFQGDGAIGPRADVYALGHIAYALLTGLPYWYDEQRSNPAVFAFFVLVMTGPPELPTKRAARRGVSLPSAFDAWFARATARVPRDRFDRTSTLVNELATVLGVASPRLSRPGIPSRTSSSPEIASVPARAETSSVVATKQIRNVPGDAGTVIYREPDHGLERSGTTTASNLTSASTAQTAPVRPSKLRLLFLIPVSMLVVGIGLAVLVRELQRDTKGSAPVSAASAASVTEDSGAAVVASPVASSITTATSPSSKPTSSVAPRPNVAPNPIPGSTVSIDSLPSIVSTSMPAPKKPSKLPDPPKPPDSQEAPESGCNPAYTVDSLGHHQPKPQCL